MTKIKICGITNPEDALASIEAGADAIGLNLVPSSKRYVTPEETRLILRTVAAAAPKFLTVAVVADLPLEELFELQHEFGCLQLHGHESPQQLVPLLPHAYKAVRIADAQDVASAANYPGEHLLADAKVTGALGGTGTVFDWNLVRELARARKLTLAGGLDATNVHEAISTVKPYAVDVASGVELVGNPRRKDSARIRDFVREVKRAS
ncbi:phosphoribosylanthranilate isomerase [Pendulispora brunnea]|uniref:N-(5'-phosphoribosyl)anthranilate isomerase n=1 Tax=Pendulispora brunnea TaxID=2905690 RepID=A0ABZ2KLR4_9BACT